MWRKIGGGRRGSSIGLHTGRPRGRPSLSRTTDVSECAGHLCTKRAAVQHNPGSYTPTDATDCCCLNVQRWSPTYL